MTPVSEHSAQTTPGSSPAISDNDATKQDPSISNAMQHEEDKMMKKRQKEQAQRDEAMEKQRQKDLEAGSEQVDKKFKALEHLLNQSKVRILHICVLAS